MTDTLISSLTTTKPSFMQRMRAKALMTKWSFLLWSSFAVVISVACWWLFPDALFWVDGGLRGILLVTSVDFVLGPLLFFLVANPGKSALARRVDVITLTSVQLMAMTWGGWQIYTQHPVAISLMREGFALPVVVKDFKGQNIQTDELPHSLVGRTPAYFVNTPTGPDAPRKYYALTRKPAPIHTQKELLSPLLSAPGAYDSAQKFQRYWAGEGAADWQTWTARHDHKPAADYRFILLSARYGNAALVLDQNNELLGHIRLPDGPPDVILPRN